MSATVVVATLAVLAARDPLYRSMSAIAAACYAVSVAWFWLESRRPSVAS
jgi:hypothetical protein